MAGLSFSDFDSLEDVLATDRFELLISPQGQAGLNQVLAVRCTQIAVPQTVIEQMPVTIQGMEFNFRGRRTYDKTIGATFVETIDAAVMHRRPDNPGCHRPKRAIRQHLCLIRLP